MRVTMEFECFLRNESRDAFSSSSHATKIKEVHFAFYVRAYRRRKTVFQNNLLPIKTLIRQPD